MSENLNNLVKIGQLHQEPPDRKEFEGLLMSASDRLQDVLKGCLLCVMNVEIPLSIRDTSMSMNDYWKSLFQGAQNYWKW